MALTWNDVTSKTNQFIIPYLVDDVYKASPVLTRLRTQRQMNFEGGTLIKQPIMYAELKGGAIARGGTFDISYVESDTALTFNLKRYYVNITLYGTDAALNRGPMAIMSTIESKMANAGGKMAKLLGTDLFLDGQGTSSTTLALDGFNAAFDDGTNFSTYGGVTRTDIASGANAGINGYYASVATLSLSAVQTAYGSCWFGNQRPDLLGTTQAVWDIFWNKLQPQQRFNEESSDVAKAGFQSMRYNGASLTVDQYAPSGNIYFMNTKFIQLWISTVPKYQFGFTGWKEAQNTDDVAGQYQFFGNIVVSSSRLQGRITGITG